MLAPQFLSTLASRQALFLGGVGFTAVLLADVVTPAELDLTLLYLPFLFLISWKCGWRIGIAAALIAFGAQIYDTRSITAHGIDPAYVAIEMINRLGVFLVVVALALPLRRYARTGEGFARIDPVSLLPNRSWFERALEHQVNSGRRFGESYAVLQIECTGLDLLSRAHGTAASLSMLHLVARTLERGLPHNQGVARTDQARFAVILGDQTLASAEQTARRTKHLLEASARECELETPFGVSLVFIDGGASAANEVLLVCEAAADAARYAVTEDLIVRRVVGQRGDTQHEFQFA